MKVNLFKCRKIFTKINDKYGIFKNNAKILKIIYYNFPFSKNVQKIIKKEKFDIVVSSGPYMNVLLSTFSNLVDVKKIGWQHASYETYFEMKNRGFWNQDAIAKEMFLKLDEYIVLTNYDKIKIKEKLGFEVKAIYNGVSFKQQQKSNLKEKRFLAVGRLEKLKGFDLLINNFKEFNKNNKEWVLEIYGDGKEQKTLEKMIEDLKLKDYVKIFNSTSNIAEKYIKSSIYCMTSRKEGFGMVVLEAMESGLPVISYDLPCIREILHNNEGIIVPYGEHKKYINAMLELANSEEKRAKLSQKSKERAKDFYMENIGKQWEKLFDEIIKK